MWKRQGPLLVFIAMPSSSRRRPEWYAGFLAGRARRFTEHRRQMKLSATLALSLITNRIWTPVLFIAFQPLQDSVFHGNDEHFLWVVAGLGAWLCWTIPLLAGRRWLRGKPVIPSSSVSAVSDPQPV